MSATWIAVLAVPFVVAWAVAACRSWSLPGREVQADMDLARELANCVTGMALENESHREEHAIEVQLPLLARFAPESRVVGVAILHRNERTWEIDTFLLSCRVIGRTVETAFLAYLVEEAEAGGAKARREGKTAKAAEAPVSGRYFILARTSFCSSSFSCRSRSR